MINTQVLKGNFIIQDYATAFTLSQGDKGVPFKVELLENGTPYTLLNDDIVTIEWLKPNGNPFLQEGNIKYGTSYIEFTTPEAVAQFSGSGTFNIIISNNNVRKGTIRREYKVVPTSMKPGSISEDVITDAITELRELSVEIADTVQNNQKLIKSNQVATQGQVNTINTNINTINTNINSINSSLEEKANKTYVDTKIGNMGNAKTFKGSCTFANLPTTATVDDYWYVTDKTTNYCWNGTSWVDIGDNLNIGEKTITDKMLVNSYSDPLKVAKSCKNILINDCIKDSKIELSCTDKVFTGGINFYNLPNVEETVLNGITYKIKSGVISLNGTATANVDIYLTPDMPFNVYSGYTYSVTAFKISGSITSGAVSPKLRSAPSATSYDLIDLTNINFTKDTYNTKITYTKDFVCNRARLYIPSGTVIDNLAFKLQIQLNEYDGKYDYGNSIVEREAGLYTLTGESIYIQSNVDFNCSYSKSLNKVDFGTSNFNDLNNKPTINGIELVGDLNADALGLQTKVNDIIVEKRNRYKENTTKYTVSILDAPVTANLFPSIVNNLENGEISDLYTYSCPVKNGTAFPANKGVTQDTPRALGMSIDWYADCTEMDIKVYEKSYCVVVVDDEIIADTIYPTVASGLNYINIKFLTKAKRHIRLLYSGKSFQGCLCDGEVTKYINTQPLLICDGDSIVEGQAGGVGVHNSQVYCWNTVVAQRMGWNLLNCGVGGSGYLKTGNMGEPNMVDRFDTYIKPYTPDVLIVSAGLNDITMTIDEVKTNIDSYWDNVKNNISTPYVIMCSPFNPSISVNSNLSDINAYLKAKATSLEYPYIDNINGITYDALGNIINERPQGGFINEDNISSYISSDNTHLTKAGAIALGNYMSMEVFRILKNNYGLLNI